MQFTYTQQVLVYLDYEVFNPFLTYTFRFFVLPSSRRQFVQFALLRTTTTTRVTTNTWLRPQVAHFSSATSMNVNNEPIDYLLDAYVYTSLLVESE